MEVQVRYRLAAPRADIGDDPITLLEALFLGKIPNDSKEMANDP
jgi:hypothetical protein